MKIAVTGGTGFVGEHLINELLTKNHHVNALSRKTQEGTNTELKWYTGDLNDEQSLELFLSDCEIVINCAGEISNSDNFERNNVNGVKILYKASVDAGLSLFIQLSSGGIYLEPSEGEITEESELSAYNEYEKSKIAAEEWLINQYDIKTVILRPTTIYGSKMPNESLRSLFSAILNKRFFFIGGKKATSCYISVDNVVSAIVKVIDSKALLIKDQKHCDAYNLSHDMYYIDFLNLAAKALKVDLTVFRVPLSFILALLWVNDASFNIELPLTSKRAKTLARKSTFSSRKFENYFSWQPLFSHSVTITDCVNSWFDQSSAK